MTTLARAVGFVLVMLWSSAAWCQATAPSTKPASAPAADVPLTEPKPADLDKSVLKLVPRECLGFLIVHNAADLAGRIDTFVRRVVPDPNEVKDFSILRQLPVESFDLDFGGSFAVVVLDPRKYAPELATMPATAPAASQPSSAGADEEAAGSSMEMLKKLPIVWVLPGKDAMTVFKKLDPVREGKYVRVDVGDVKWYCRDVPGQVLIALNTEWLDAFGASGSVLERLSATERATIARGNAAAWVDFRAAGALKGTRRALSAMGEAFVEHLPFDMEDWFFPLEPIVKYVAATRGPALAQAEARVFAGRVVEQGLVLEVRGRYPRDSAVGQVLLAAKPADRPLLAGLPNMPYWFAAGATADIKTPPDLQAKIVGAILDDGALGSLTPQAKASLKKAMLGVHRQVRSVQWYFGGVTSAEGMLALACVLRVDSPEQVRGLLVEAGMLLPDVLGAIVGSVPAGLKVESVPGQETVDQVKVDALVIRHPDLDQMDEQNRIRMRSVWGDEKLRLLIAPAGGDTLVVTFGGGVPFLKEALKTAAGQGAIEADPGVKKALAMLPSPRVAVGVLNLGNVWNVYANIMRVFMGTEAHEMTMHLPQITTPMPLAGGFSIDANELAFTVFVPTESIATLARTIQAVSVAEVRAYSSQESGENESGEATSEPATVPATMSVERQEVIE